MYSIESSSPFTCLPDPLIVKIFSYLPADEALNTSNQVCWKFKLLHKEIIQKFEGNGLTPLHQAALANSIEKIKILVLKGFNLEQHNLEGQTPLLLTFLNKQWRAFRVLVTLRANINVFDKNGDAPIHLAIKQRCAESFMMAVKSNANLNLKNVYGRTPLHVATDTNQMERVKYLLENGADPEISDAQRIKPIDEAARLRLQPIIELFLASPKCVLNDYTLSLITRIIEFRLAEGYNCNSKFALGKTHLHWSIIGKNHDLTHGLLHRNVNPNTPDNEGYFPIHYAALLGEWDSTEALIKASSCEINAPLPDGRTALHLAIQSGKSLCAKLLIENRADLDAVNKQKQTPLHFLVIHCSSHLKKEDLVMLVKLLIKSGANPNFKDMYGKIPADYIIDSQELSYQLSPSFCELM